MTRQQFEHILRAAAGITGADRFVVIGSQAILGQFPGAPDELLASMELDVFTLRSPEDANLIEGSIGEGSTFERTFGYHAHGVAEETATLPDGWKDRLIPVQSEATGRAVGLCLEVHDLAVSKLIAGREKDLEFIGALLRHGLAKAAVIRERLAATPLEEKIRNLSLARINRLESDVVNPPQ